MNDRRGDAPRLFAARLVRLRESLGLTVPELSVMIPFSAHLMYRYERGNDNSMPRIDNAQKIAGFYGVTLEWLLSSKDDTRDPLPVSPERMVEIKAKHYLRLAVAATPIKEEDMPEAVDDLFRVLKLLARWSTKPAQRAQVRGIRAPAPPQPSAHAQTADPPEQPGE